MKYYLSVFLGVLSVPLIAFAGVRINEVAWMGTAASQYSEWIELYNSGDEAVPLAGWKLYKTGDQLLFTLNKTIAAGGYLLVERTTPSAPDAVPGINDESGTFGTAGLKNSGEDLVLKDKEGTSIDSLSFAGEWPAGDTKTKDTMQWNGSKWVTATGTPDAANATVPIVATQTQSPQVQNVPLQTTAATTVVVPPKTQATVPPPSIEKPVIVNTPDQVIITPPNPVIVETPSSSVIVAKSTVVSKKTKSTAKKTFPVSAVSSADIAVNNAAADQLQTSATAPKENNHTKIVILAGVAFIGMALFLLLMRFKAL